ncbi:hypothetical protein ABDK56_11220 [Sphingomonas sp. ASV193]|uniref:hypothetical protein n=1 Tax=Sphingomonas sp. ASV193 TaxID=3144405 RepID=UPI0032E91F6E
MRKFTIGAAAVSLAAIAVAGCTTTGMGTGYSNNGVGATFTWTENAGTRGSMVAQLTNGQVFQGPYFQITSESTVMSDYDPLWYGWGGRFGYGRYGSWGGGWGGRPFGWGWGGWGPWGPERETITQYSGQVLANLAGPGGYMRCHFTLMRPSAGMVAGGVGECQLPTGNVIHAQFGPGRYR